MSDLKTDPDFEEALYPLNPEELMSLTESLKSEGCRDPIVIWNDTIIDGHNRYKICKKYDIEFKTVNKDFESRDEAMIWILNNQLSRRNLNDFKKGEIFLRMKSIIARRAKPNQQVRKGDQPGATLPNLAKLSPPIDTREEIAKAANLSHGTISKIDKVLTHGKPEEIEKARKGETSIHAAFEKVNERERPKPDPVIAAITKARELDKVLKQATIDAVRAAREVGRIVREMHSYEQCLKDHHISKRDADYWIMLSELSNEEFEKLIISEEERARATIHQTQPPPPSNPGVA